MRGLGCGADRACRQDRSVGRTKFCATFGNTAAGHSYAATGNGDAARPRCHASGKYRDTPSRYGDTADSAAGSSSERDSAGHWTEFA